MDEKDIHNNKEITMIASINKHVECCKLIFRFSNKFALD